MVKTKYINTYTNKQYTICHPVIFAMVMRDPNLCKEFLRRVITDRKIRQVRFHSEADDDVFVEMPTAPVATSVTYAATGTAETEKTIIISPTAKTVRLDVLFDDDECWYDIELQVNNRDCPIKRSRYYHSVMDVSSFRRGQNYDELRPNYVIFICMFDPFNLNQPLYRFERYDVKNNLPLGDGQVTIFMNGVCSEAVPDELKSFYLYLQTGEMASDNDDTFVNKLDAAVQDAIQKEEVRYQMTLYDEMIISKEKLERVQAEEAQMQWKLAETKEKLERAQEREAQAQADADKAKADVAQMQGKLEEAENRAIDAETESVRMVNATMKLCAAGRMEDAQKMVTDKEFRTKIFEELSV